MADQKPSERRFWQPPNLHSGDETRGVGWIDLFFDLFFVAVIAELAHHLTAHPDAAGVRTFLFLFIPVVVGVDWRHLLRRALRNRRYRDAPLPLRADAARYRHGGLRA